jgi:hypothetical protein
MEITAVELSMEQAVEVVENAMAPLLELENDVGVSVPLSE